MERKQRGSPSEAVSGQKVCRNYATVFRGPLSHVCGPALLAPCGQLYVCGCGSRDARSLWHALALLSWIIPGASEAGVCLYSSHCPVVSGGGVGVPSRAVRSPRPDQIRKRVGVLPGPQGMGGKGTCSERRRGLAERGAGPLRGPKVRGAVRKVASRGYRRRPSDKRCGAGMPTPEGYFPQYVLWLVAEGLYGPARE